MTFRHPGAWRIAFGAATLVVCLLLGFMPGAPLNDQQRGFAIGMGASMAVAMLLFGALWLYPPYRRWLQDKLRDPVLVARQRRYNRDFFPPMIAYAVVMLAWRTLLDHVDATWLRVVVALLPAALQALVVRAMVRYVRGADELQRRVELEAVAISAALVGALYMALGFLQIAKLIAVPADVAMIWVFPALCLSYGAAKLAIARRYL